MSGPEYVTETFHTGTIDDVKHLGCAACGGALRAAHMPDPKRPSLGVVCPSCLWAVHSDGLPFPPPWVAQAGHSLETTPGPRSVTPGSGH
jgi:hypothetical protein